MAKLGFFSLLLIVGLAHLGVFYYEYQKEEIAKPKAKYSKVSVHLVSISKDAPKKVQKKPTKKVIKKPPKPKEVKKVVKKKVQKTPKPIAKNPPKKQVIKKLAQKPAVKKTIQKQITQKKPIKEIKKTEQKIVKKVQKQEIKKEVQKPQTKVVKTSTPPKKSVKSNEKAKEFKENYKTALRAAIDRNKRYPAPSKRLREQGTVLLSFRVLQNGVFENIKIKKKCKHKRLNRAAFNAIYKTKQFKPFPKEMNKDFIDLTLPIKFALN